MEAVTGAISWLLNLGAAVFVPLVMIIAGLIVRMKPLEAIKAGVTLGVAFTGMSLLIDFMSTAISPAAEAITINTGVHLPIIDGGWTTVATACWGWPYGFLLFPLMVVINIAMIALKKTNTFNADVLNVWGKIFTTAAVYFLTNNLILAFVAASIQIVLEIVCGDAHQHRIEKLTGIPGITCTHRMIFTSALMYPVDCLLRKISVLNKEVNATTVKDKIGVFAEDSMLGLILGIVFALVARYDVAQTLQLAIQCAASLTLFPVVASYFTKALTPISTAISEFMNKRFPGRTFCIGMDWQFMGASNEMWLAVYWNTLVTLFLAMVLPGNELLPFAGIINVAIAIAAYLVTEGNLPRMLILCTLFAPAYIYAGTFFAETITELATSTGAVTPAAGELIPNSSIEAPVFTYGLSQLLDIVNGNFWPAVALAVWAVCFVLYRRSLLAEKAADEAGGWTPEASKAVAKEVANTLETPAAVE